MTAPTLIPDTLIWPKMKSLRDCLCAEIENSGLPEVCWCGLAPGGAPPALMFDDCSDCGGMAWVRLVNAYPSIRFPSPLAEPNNCGSMMAAVLEVGIGRCVTVGSQNGELPTPEEYEDAYEIQLADMAAMRRAIYCCDALPSKLTMLGTYTPFMMGGAIGGYWTLTISES